MKSPPQKSRPKAKHRKAKAKKTRAKPKAKSSDGFVYVLGSVKGRLTYIGWTTDIERRLAQHNGGSGAKFTRGREWVLLYAERHETRNAAMRREYFLKRDKRFRASLKT